MDSGGGFAELAGGAEHPLLGSSLELADGRGGGLLQSGRLSLATHPWLAEHDLGELVLLPGAALLDLALGAARQVGCEAVEELALAAPPLLPESGSLALQLFVSGPDEEGRREIAIHSRPEGEEGEWVKNASGTLTSEAPTLAPLPGWPPEGAEPLEPERI